MSLLGVLFYLFFIFISESRVRTHARVSPFTSRLPPARHDVTSSSMAANYTGELVLSRFQTVPFMLDVLNRSARISNLERGHSIDR